MNKAIVNKIIKARSAMILDQPFFGSLALRLKMVEKESIPTLAVDGKHIFYNPSFVEQLSFSLTKSAMAHEVLHCVLDHINRRGARQPRKWNYANDYIVNSQLKKSGFEIGSSWLYEEKWSGPEWSSDQIYNLLPDDPEGEALDELMDGLGSPAERAQEAREWRVATIQAANVARAIGRLPGDLERFLDKILKPQVNWVEKLVNFVNETTKDDYNWMRPNRRREDIYMPSLHNESMGEIAVFIDTSGSIGQKTYGVFRAEITSIKEDARPSMMYFMFCDDEVNGEHDLGPEDKVPTKLKGGGGTSFKPPFERLAKREIKPKCAVYLTDLYGDFGPEPNYPVLWVSISDLKAPWGETIHIDDAN